MNTVAVLKRRGGSGYWPLPELDTLPHDVDGSGKLGGAHSASSSARSGVPASSPLSDGGDEANRQYDGNAV